MTMRIKIRSHLFLLFGVQGILHVIYWEVIKGYPACIMCKGYRVLYTSILVTALIYRYRASFFRLLLLCGLTVTESLWSLWEVVQKMGLLAQKCHSSWRIIDGHSVFASCQSSHEPLLKLFLSPVGLNAMLSQLMFGYVVYVLWRILKQHRRVALLILILCPVVVNNVAASAIDPRFKKALDQQTHRSKLYQKDLQQLQTRSHQQIDQYADEARSATGVKQPNTGCTGKCPSFTPTPDVVPPLQVCMSFSVPLQVWKDLNEDLIRHNGVFVVKGLPNNSFQAFAEKVLEFRKLGITAPIQIDPKLFERLNVKHVPLFIVHDEDEPHIVSGTLTVPYVMDLMHIKIGEGR